MKGDFTRSTFRKEKHYRSVIMQQGRLQLDADWNEQVDILNYRQQTLGKDVVGLCGVPKNNDGFRIQATPDGDLLISPGRIYVDGLLCELDAAPSLRVDSFPENPANKQVIVSGPADEEISLRIDQWVRISSRETEAADQPGMITQVGAVDSETGLITLTDDLSAFQTHTEVTLQPLITYRVQPYLPRPPALNPADGRTDLLYLEVWERHITPIEDGEIREVALGGADTTTRTQLIGQIKILPGVEAEDCDAPIEGWPPQSGSGRLSTRLQTGDPVDDPCIVPPGSGYRGIENHLYRVEIHRAGDLQTATFKWSRDNGSLAFAIEEFIEGLPNQIRVESLGRDRLLSLRIGDWVEVSGEDSDLMGEPGIIAQIDDLNVSERILILSEDVSAYKGQKHPRVRRWDQSSGEIPLSSDPIDLEEGIQVQFSGEDFRSGDYWMFAARTATRDVERLSEALALGIERHYCKLALVRWEADGDNWSAEIEDCRATFPGLSEICAEDICFDNENCDLPDTETVQDALERLCARRDLRFHNKHLHGWGIVCGMRVVCGPESSDGSRQKVTVKEGYAIDCDGNDIVLEADQTLNIINAIKNLQAGGVNNGILDENGNGEVCLTLRLNRLKKSAIEVEPFTNSSNLFQDLLKGSLLLNFYNRCIKNVLDALRAEFSDPGDQPAALVGQRQKRISTFLNLAIQILRPENGKYVFLSQKEHDILFNFYKTLRELLQSETFCAMYENREFPDYPFARSNLSTIFGKGYHTRLRLHPSQKVAATVGAGNKIHLFDLSQEEMVAEIEVPGGEGLDVQDVAFSSKGDQLYAIATLRGTDTVFAVADVRGLKFVWRPVTVLCDIKLVTLTTAPRVAPQLVYAIGQGKGLYALNPENVALNPQPLAAFNAVGQLIIVQEDGTAYASAAQGTVASNRYDRILHINLRDGVLLQDIPLTVNGKPASGDDDMTVVPLPAQNTTKMYVVADDPTGADQKYVVVYGNATSGGRGKVTGQITVENTDIRLTYHSNNGFLLLAFEDSFRLGLLDVQKDSLIANYRHPVQIFPNGLAVAPVAQQTYALNFLSNTINSIPDEFLLPENQIPLDTLATYRAAVLEAFADLLGGFLQYLKDCFCDQFLVDCPECDPDDKIYLACVKIRDNQIYQVCNFSKRKYVKSFPLFSYWFSVIPVMPLIKKGIEKFCCAILPDIFGKFSTAKLTTRLINLNARQVRTGVAMMQKKQVTSGLSEGRSKARIMTNMAREWFSERLRRPEMLFIPQVKQSEVVGQPLSEAQSRLEKVNVAVEKVEPYTPGKGAENLRAFVRSPLNLKPGTRVILYEQQGVVKYYSTVEEPPEVVKELQKTVQEQKASLDEVSLLKKELTKLNKSLSSVQKSYQKALKDRDSEIAGLKETVAALQSGLGEVDKLKKEFSQFKKGGSAARKK